MQVMPGARIDLLQDASEILVAVETGGNTLWDKSKSTMAAALLGLQRNSWSHDVMTGFVMAFVVIWGIGIPIIPQVIVAHAVSFVGRLTCESHASDSDVFTPTR